MSLDVVRAIQKTKGEAMNAFVSRVSQILKQASKQAATDKSVEVIQKSLSDIILCLQSGPEYVEAMSRDFCISLANTYIAALLLEHAIYTKCDIDRHVVISWCRRELCPAMKNGIEQYTRKFINQEKELVFQGYNPSSTFPAMHIR